MTTDEIMQLLSELGAGPRGLLEVSKTLRAMEAKLRLADELVDHILTSESRNPELALAKAYHIISKREAK